MDTVIERKIPRNNVNITYENLTKYPTLGLLELLGRYGWPPELRCAAAV
jgi:hypothetical protein